MVMLFVDFLKGLYPCKFFFYRLWGKAGKKAWNGTEPHRGTQFWTFFSFFLLYIEPWGVVKRVKYQSVVGHILVFAPFHNTLMNKGSGPGVTQCMHMLRQLKRDYPLTFFSVKF